MKKKSSGLIITIAILAIIIIILLVVLVINTQKGSPTTASNTVSPSTSVKAVVSEQTLRNTSYTLAHDQFNLKDGVAVTEGYYSEIPGQYKDSKGKYHTISPGYVSYSFAKSVTGDTSGTGQIATIALLYRTYAPSATSTDENLKVPQLALFAFTSSPSNQTNEQGNLLISPNSPQQEVPMKQVQSLVITNSIISITLADNTVLKYKFQNNYFVRVAN